MRNIQAVTFDLWQTLVMDDRELGRSRTRLRLEGTSNALSDVGYSFTMDHLQDAYRACYRICRSRHKEGKDYSFHDQVAIFVDGIKPGLGKLLPTGVMDIISHCYAEAFFDFPPVIAVGAREALQSVKNRGYLIGLISNTGMTPGILFRRFLCSEDLLQFFHVLTFSDEVELCKPSTQIFDLTLKSLGASAENTVHVGDHIKNDILGANQAGMISILVGSAEGQEKLAEPHLNIGDLHGLPQALDKLAEMTD